MTVTSLLSPSCKEVVTSPLKLDPPYQVSCSINNTKTAHQHDHNKEPRQPSVTFKSDKQSLSLVFSNCRLKDIENNDSLLDVDVTNFTKNASRGRRRSEDKRSKSNRQSSNGQNRGKRGSRAYQNFDNNSSNGNSGGDGNGEDNDDSNDDDDDEYLDDDEDEEEEEEDDDDDDDDDKNDDDDEDDASSCISSKERTNSLGNSMDEKLLCALQAAGATVDATVAAENGPVAAGTPITLQGILCHEALPGGVLVVNVKWRNKTYCGSLIDCNSPLKQKLRGRKKTISGSSTGKGNSFRTIGNKRKGKNADDDSDDGRPGKRSCTMKGAPSPQPSPTLIECPEPGCGKKYKHINGLRYHQTHAHLDKIAPDESNNSDDRSTTTPSPEDDFKEPGSARTLTRGRGGGMATRNRSVSPGVSDTSAIKEESNSKSNRKTKGLVTEDKVKTESAENKIEQTEKVEPERPVQVKKEVGEDERSSLAVEQQEDTRIKEEPVAQGNYNIKHSEEEGEFVEVADKSTDTRMMNQSQEPALTPVTQSLKVDSPMEVVPTQQVPEAATEQEVWETVVDSGHSGELNFGGKETVSIEEMMGGDQEGGDTVLVEGGKAADVRGVVSKDERRQIVLPAGSMNQLGIEVEDISENEEDIDPGKEDIDYDGDDEVNRALDGLQKSTFHYNKTSDKQAISSLKDPNLISSITAAKDLMDNVITSEDGITAKSVILETGNMEGTSNIEECTERTNYMASLGLRPEKEHPDVAMGTSTDSEPMKEGDTGAKTSLSMLSLVSKSLTASRSEPPLINTDAPSMRFKYFTCRSYGDQTYTLSTSNLTSTSASSATTTLSLIRNPETLKQEHAKGYASVHSKDMPPIVREERQNTGTSNVGPNYTRSSTQAECMISSIHKHGPKEAFKEESIEGSRNMSTSGSVIMSSDRFPTHSAQAKCTANTSMSYSSPKSSIAVTSMKRATGLCSSERINVNESLSKKPGLDSSEVNGTSEELTGGNSEKTGNDARDDDKLRVLPRQPPTLIPKHSRLAAPSLPVGVAHPYHRGSQFSTVSTSAASTSGLSVTSPPGLSRDSVPPKSLTPDPEGKPLGLKKPRAEKAQVIPVGEVGPVAVKRSQIPAIHVGLPSVVPVGAPGLKGQASLHASVRQGLKDERSTTPLGLSRKAASPRALSLSPKPISTSPRPPALSSSRQATTEMSSSKIVLPVAEHASKCKTAERDDSSEESNVVILKEDKEKSREGKSGSESDRSAERSPYANSQDKVSAEQLKIFQLQQQQRQLYQQLAQSGPTQMALALGYDPWALRMMEQQQQMNQAEEGRELLKDKRDEPQRQRPEKSDSHSSGERYTIEHRGTDPVPPPRSDLTRHQSDPSLSRDTSRPSPSRDMTRSSETIPRLTSAEEILGRASQRIDEASTRAIQKVVEGSGRGGSKGDEPPEKRLRADTGRAEELSERELQRQKYRQQEEYLSKQMLQQKISMFKMDSEQQKRQQGLTGLRSESKDKGRDEDDFPRAKSPLENHYGDRSRGQDLSRNSKTSHHSEPDSRPELSHKHSARTTWSSRSPVTGRHVDSAADERAYSHLPSYLQSARLSSKQMLGQMNFDPATGAPLLPMLHPSMLMPHPLAMPGLMMSMSSGMISGSNTSTTTTATSSRSRDPDSSPYRTPSDRSSPLTVGGRSSRPRSPPRLMEPRPRSPVRSSSPSGVRREYKGSDRSPVVSVASRSIYRANERVSSPSYVRATTSSPSVVSKGFRTSPTSQLHKVNERIPTSSPSTKMYKSASPASTPHRLTDRRDQEGQGSRGAGIHTEAPKHKPQDRPREEVPPQSRGSIITSNLAVRRGDVTRGVMTGEEILRHQQHSEEERMRHQYMMYRLLEQQQQEAYAMQHSSRADQYYGKRQ
ncbi:predicted protein [Nematostella vectensis]|uniref:C2H2-type domain-containing protein n=1 Tax=Nematostella vectensis TaxID=45351 RepID=A7RS30_NEMVE|nr:predicted protein [Nematostella vectensis]|eukprot:XP_001637739.1 predicted protein [Nematostella vectensis]